MNRPRIEINQAWFEMQDLARPRLASADWVPLAGLVEFTKGKFWEPDCVHTCFAVSAIRLPVEARDSALDVSWGDAHETRHGPRLDAEGQFLRAGTFVDYGSGTTGDFLVLRQAHEADRTTEWHLDQDLVFALGLKREEDKWVCPSQDYHEVVRLRRTDEGSADLVEIRAEHLRDYLCARGSGLLLATYALRRAAFDHRPHLTWETEALSAELGGGRWEGHCMESGARLPSGAHASVVSGELWRNEWVEPASQSPRVRGDRVESHVPFIIRNDGTRATGADLNPHYLRFHPRVVMRLLEVRGGRLNWYSEDTGSVGLTSGDVHFGANELGLVCVLGKDIAELPERVQQLWAAQNVAPEGSISSELFDAQMQCQPAGTTAPEDEFRAALVRLDEAARARFGQPLRRAHQSEERLLSRVHRFLCVEPDGVFLLCKEITRLVADCLDMGLLKRLRPGEEKGLRSLKRLERLLQAAGLEDAGEIMAPLFAASDLRQSDAHPPSDDPGPSLATLGVQADMTEVEQGKQVIRSVARSLDSIASAVPHLPELEPAPST